MNDIEQAANEAQENPAGPGDSLLRAITRGTSDAVFAKDLNGRYVWVNPRHARFLGLPAAETIGKTDADLFPQQFAALLGQSDQDILASHGPVTYEIVSNLSGEEQRLLTTKSVYYDDDGNVVGLIGVSRDITEERRREIELAEERERLRVVVESSTVGIVLVDARAGKVSMVNIAAVRLLRLRAGEQCSLEEFIAGVQQRRLDGSAYGPGERPIERALFDGQTVEAEQVVLEFPNGDRKLVLMNAAPVREGEKVIAAVEVIQDMSGLEEAERLKQDFQAMVAHDIRSPLAAIMAAVEVARDDVQTGNVTEVLASLDAIDGQTERLVQLANDVLDAAQMEIGAFSVNMRADDLPPLLDQAVSMLASTSQVPVEVNAPSALPAVRMDHGRVLQVVLNLLTNAARFAEPGTSIVVEAEASQDEIIVRVRNRGEGIPAEKRPLLFQKFARIAEGDKYKASSIGLGLPISKGIVEAHGGRIWMERQEETEETIFVFTLPLAEKRA